MEYTLFEATITGLRLLHRFLFLKFDQGLIKSGKKSENQLQLVTIFLEF